MTRSQLFSRWSDRDSVLVVSIVTVPVIIATSRWMDVCMYVCMRIVAYYIETVAILALTFGAVSFCFAASASRNE